MLLRSMAEVSSRGVTILARAPAPVGSSWHARARGIAGPEGKRGPPGNIISGWIVDRSNYRITPRLSDGSLGPPLELRALFEPEDNAAA